MKINAFERFLSPVTKLKPSTIFWMAIITMAFIYNFNKVMFYRPSGIHQWRNCVSAGYAQNFYHGADFFQPKTEAFVTDDLNSNVLFLEAPILYYAVGILYKTFGYHEFLYRLLNTLIGFIGMFYLFKAANHYLKNTLFALTLPVILFTSTVYIFYMHGFMTDATGIAVALIALYFFYRFYDTKKHIFLALTMFFFMIAGLLKIQSLYAYFALGAVFITEWLFNFNFGKNNEQLFNRKWLSLGLFISALAVIAAWYYFATEYHAVHKSFINSTRISSVIWKLDDQLRKEIWDEFVIRFKHRYFHSQSFIWFTLLVFIHNIVFFKKHNRLLNAMVILTFVQIILFNLLFFESIGRCDYYNINSFIFFILVYFNLFLYLKNRFPKLYHSKYFAVFIIAANLYLLWSGQKGQSNKYKDWHYIDSKIILDKCGQITPYLRQLGINREDKVYFTPDQSQNNSLYLMDQLGNTDIGLGGTFNEKVEFLKKRELKYIMVADEKLLEDYKKQSIYLNDSNEIGVFRDVHIFKVK